MSQSAPNTLENRNQEATIWVGNLDAKCTEELMWELGLQFGPVTNCFMPVDKITGEHQRYCFIQYDTPQSAEYARNVLNLTKLYGNLLRVRRVTDEQESERQWAAKLFVGGLDPSVDDKLLYDTFSRFGAVLGASVVVDEEGKNKQFGFVNFDCFEAADKAIAAMNGQYLANRTINVHYAIRDGATKERHGSVEERLLASKAQTTKSLKPLKPASFNPTTLLPRRLNDKIPSTSSTLTTGRTGFTAPAGMGVLGGGGGGGGGGPVGGGSKPPMLPQHNAPLGPPPMARFPPPRPPMLSGPTNLVVPSGVLGGSSGGMPPPPPPMSRGPMSGPPPLPHVMPPMNAGPPPPHHTMAMPMAPMRSGPGPVPMHGMGTRPGGRAGGRAGGMFQHAPPGLPGKIPPPLPPPLPMRGNNNNAPPPPPLMGVNNRAPHMQPHFAGPPPNMPPPQQRR